MDNMSHSSRSPQMWPADVKIFVFQVELMPQRSSSLWVSWGWIYRKRKLGRFFKGLLSVFLCHFLYLHTNEPWQSTFILKQGSEVSHCMSNTYCTLCNDFMEMKETSCFSSLQYWHRWYHDCRLEWVERTLPVQPCHEPGRDHTLLEAFLCKCLRTGRNGSSCCVSLDYTH